MSALTTDDRTICAVATAPGRSGLAVIRVSGGEALKITQKFCKFLPKQAQSHRIYYGHFKTDVSEIDEVLVSYFEKGKSFTGEQTVEVSCHGSPIVCSQILDALVTGGARIAEPGEFTFRAFMSGRIDLVQAEGVLDLIESESRQASQFALRQLDGELSAAVKSIQAQVVQVLAHCEANIDFASEDIEIESEDSLRKKLEQVLIEIDGLLATYSKGKAIHDGLIVTLIGLPNVGKSSLLNSLVKQEKAIVTDVAGTTRDIVEGEVWINGVKLKFFDTAGMRVTDDKIENIGVEKAKSKVRESDLCLILVDSVDPHLPDLTGLSLNNEKVLVVQSKSDLVVDEGKNSSDLDARLNSEYAQLDWGSIAKLSVSCRVAGSVEELKYYIASQFGLFSDHSQSALLTNSRHWESLVAARDNLEQAIHLLSQKESSEFVAFELLDGFKAIQAMLGEQFDDEVLDRVFSEFCLGK